jgi:hypothetical protein
MERNLHCGQNCPSSSEIRRIQARPRKHTGDYEIILIRSVNVDAVRAKTSAIAG